MGTGVYKHPSFPNVRLDGFPAQDRPILWDAFKLMRPAARAARDALMSGDSERLEPYRKWFERKGQVALPQRGKYPASTASYAHLFKVSTIVREIHDAIERRRLRFVDVGNGRTNSAQNICGYVILNNLGLTYQDDAPRSHLEIVKSKLKQYVRNRPDIQIQRPSGEVGSETRSLPTKDPKTGKTKLEKHVLPTKGWDITQTYSALSSKRDFEIELAAAQKRKPVLADIGDDEERQEGKDDEIWVQVIVKTHDGDAEELADTLYHELSHVIGRTYDVTYQEDVAESLAGTQPLYAVANATNYARFMREFLPTNKSGK